MACFSWRCLRVSLCRPCDGAPPGSERFRSVGGVSGFCVRRSPRFALVVACLVSFCVIPDACCIVCRMRCLSLCATCARLSIGAPGLVDGSVSIRARQGGGTVGEGFVRGEYAQERQ